MQSRVKKTSKSQQHTHTTIITLNTDSNNSAIKRHRLASCRRKQPALTLLPETHFPFKDIHYLRVEA